MNSFFNQYSALPSLHPAVIHFPIVLLILAVGMELMDLLFLKGRWEKMSRWFYALGFLSAFAAVITGREAEDKLYLLPPEAQHTLQEHSDLANYVVVIFGVVAISRFLLRKKKLYRFFLLPFAFVGIGLLYSTADHGGALVYRYQVFAKKEVLKKPSLPQPQLPIQHLPKEVQPFETTLTQAHFQDLALSLEEDASITVIQEEKQGLTLNIQKGGFLLLSPTYKDLQMEVSVELLDFYGAIALVHHYLPEKSFHYFQVSTEGKSTLGYQDAKGNHGLSVKPLPVTSSMVLTLSVAGSHLKGYKDGKLVVHAHKDPGEKGKAGLWLKGSGKLRLKQIKITPANSGGIIN